MTEAAAAVRVLVADDDASARAILVEMLESMGYAIAGEAGCGRDAVSLASAKAPDVVLLDVHMLDMSGIDAAKEIAAAQPGMAIVLFTGDHTLTVDDADLAESSAISMLAKPTPPRMLDHALRLAVKHARALGDARKAASGAQRELVDRRTIERAKGLLMRRTGGSEQEAYRILQRTSQDKSIPMVVVAQQVLDSEPGLQPSPPRH